MEQSVLFFTVSHKGAGKYSYLKIQLNTARSPQTAMHKSCLFPLAIMKEKL